MTVELVTAPGPEIVSAMETLVPQLSRSSAPLDAEGVERFLAQPGVFLFVFRPNVWSKDPGVGDCCGADADFVPDHTPAPILGMLTLVTFEIPTGVRAWIEDVVVDAAARGQGAGQALVEAAVAHAQGMGARTVDLTSRPSREAANRLYRRCGFELRETNVYRHASASAS